MLGVLWMQIVAEIAEASEIQSLVPAFHEFMGKNTFISNRGKGISAFPLLLPLYRGFGNLCPVNSVLQQADGLAGSWRFSQRPPEGEDPPVPWIWPYLG